MAEHGTKMAAKLLFHYTDKRGYDTIRAGGEWVFRASRSPGNHPHGAYFTDWGDHTPLLAKKLRIPRRKTAFFFCFLDWGDLIPLKGGRGLHIFYSKADYHIGEDRQVRHGQRKEQEG